MNEVKNTTPEELLTSIVSETNQEWVDFNNAPGHSHSVSEKAFKFRREREIDKNYHELVHKFEFEYNGVQIAFIKIWFVADGKKTLTSTRQLQKVNGRWVRAPILGFDKLSRVIEKLDSKVLADLFSRTNRNPKISDLYEKTRGFRNVLDIDKLYDVMVDLLNNDKNRLDSLLGK